ncbi:MAG: class II aldolase/adducin family protein, partial [Moorea sp. SIO3I8]|nr:class II aldolase/adducin family protein [Moorena sp. SIO3I8]
TFGQISIFEQNDDTIITTINNQPLAVLSGVDFGDITEADFVL